MSYCLLMDSTRLCRELNCRAAIRVTKVRKKAPPQHAPLKNFFLGWARETQVHISSTELLLLSSRGVVSERVSKQLPSGEGGLPSGGAPSNSPRHEVDHHGDQDDSAVDGSALKHFGQPVYVDEDGASLYAAGSVEARVTALVGELDLVLQVLELLIHVEAQDDENDRAPGASAVAAPGKKFHPLHGGGGERRGEGSVANGEERGERHGRKHSQFSCAPRAGASFRGHGSAGHPRGPFFPSRRALGERRALRLFSSRPRRSPAAWV